MRPTYEQICLQALNGELGILEAAGLLYSSDSDDWEYFLVIECPEIEVLAEMIELYLKHPDNREVIEQKYREAAMQVFFDLLDVLTMPPVPEVEPPVKHPIPRSTPQEYQW